MRLLLRSLAAVLMLVLLGLAPASAQGLAGAVDAPTASDGLDDFGFKDPPPPQPTAVRTTPCKQCEPLLGMINAAGDRVALFTEVAEEQTAAGRQIDSEIAYTEDLLSSAKLEEAKWGDRFRLYSDISFGSNDPRVDEASKQSEVARARIATIEARLKELAAEKDAQAARLAETLAEVQMWQGELARLEAELAECERLCRERGGISTETDDGFVRTWCTACSALASALNDTIGSRRTLPKLIEQARAELAPLEAARDELTAAQRSAVDAADAAIQDLAAQPDAAATAAAETALSAASKDLRKLDAQIDAAYEAVTPAAAKLAALEAYAEQLKQLEAEQRAALAECEKNCPQPLEEMPDPVADPAVTPAPDPGFVTTDCPACEAIASQLNDTVGSLISLRANLATAEADLAAAKAKLADLNAEERAVLDAESAAIQELAASDAGTNANAAAARDKASKRLSEIDDEIDNLHLRTINPTAKQVAELPVEIARLEALEKNLREQLADCEKQCAAAEEPAVMPDPVPETPSPFVTTDCPACEALASLFNDTIGSLGNLREDLAAAEAALSDAEKKISDLEAEERTALDAADRAIQNLAKLNESGTPDPDAVAQAEAARDATSKRIGELDDQLSETFLNGVDRPLSQARQLRAEIARLEQLEKSLREQLAECEKSCAPPPAEDPAVMPDPVSETPSPFVTTDCPACEALASFLNDTIGSLMLLRADRTAAQKALDEAMAELTEMETAERAALDAATAAIQQETALGPNGDPAALAAAETAKTEALKRVDDLDTKIDEFSQGTAGPAQELFDALDAQIQSLQELEASLRKKLAECELNCAEPVEETAVAPAREPAPDVPATVTTDCPSCEDIAAALRRTMESLTAKGRELDSAASSLAEAREQLATTQAELATVLEAGAKASTDAVNAEAAGDTAGVQAARQQQTDASLRIGELMNKADEIQGSAIAALNSAIAALTAEYNDLVNGALQLRADLEDCEKTCGKEATSLHVIPDFRVSLSQQEEECQRNRECAIEAILTNEADGAYNGPLFLSADFALALPEDNMIGGGWCTGAAKGKSMCYFPEVDVQEGATLTLILPAIAEFGVCVTLETPYAKDPEISAWVQFGLTYEGYSLGTIDGQVGRKILAAIDELLASDDAPAPVSLSDEELRALMLQMTPENRHLIEAEIFDRLFGEQPGNPEDRDDMLDCVDLKLKRDAMTRAPAAEEEDEDLDLETDDPGIGINLQFGGGDEEEHDLEHEEEEGFGFPGGPEIDLPGLGGFSF